MSVLSLIRFRKLGIRGLSGFTTFRRRVLAESGIRAMLAPFRMTKNFRRRFGRGISTEKFLPSQLVARGSLPSLLGFGIGGKAYTKIFGKTSPMAKARSMYERRKRLTNIYSRLGPLKVFTGRRRLKIPKLPTLGAAFRKFRSGANKIRVSAPRKPRTPSGSTGTTPKAAGPRAAPGLSARALSSALNKAVLSAINKGITGTAAIPGTKGVAVSLAPKNPIKRLGKNTKLSLTFSGKGSKSVQSALAVHKKNLGTKTGKAIASAFNTKGPAGIARAVSRLSGVKSIRARQQALKILATKGGAAANKSIQKSLAKQARGKLNSATRVTPKPTPKPKTLLSKAQRVLRQLAGRIKSGDIKNVFFPRRDPRRGTPGKRGGRTI